MKKNTLIILIAALVVIATIVTVAVILIPKKVEYEIVEIVPYQEDGAFYYCKCTLASGDVVWMEIWDNEYASYFDPEAPEDDNKYAPRSVKYDTPVTISGKSTKLPKELGISKEKKVKAFNFDSADIDLTSNADAKRELVGVEYTKSLEIGMFVYTEINRFEIIKVAGSGTYITKALGICKTQDGDDVEILISIDDYKAYFDKYAQFNHDLFNPQYPDPIDFVSSIRVYGVINDEKQFEFRYADPDAIRDANAKNQPAVEFTGSHKKDDPVYVTLKSITTEYTVSDQLGMGAFYYLCSAVTTKGNTVWIYISLPDFNTYFGVTQDTPSFDYGTITLNNVKVYGHAKSVEDFVGVTEKITSQWVISFEKTSK